MAWPAEAKAPTLAELRFVESKWRGHDSIGPHQVDWLRAARAAGVPLESFLIVEWSFAEV